MSTFIEHEKTMFEFLDENLFEGVRRTQRKAYPGITFFIKKKNIVAEIRKIDEISYFEINDKIWNEFSSSFRLKGDDIEYMIKLWLIGQSMGNLTPRSAILL